MQVCRFGIDDVPSDDSDTKKLVQASNGAKPVIIDHRYRKW